MQVFQSWADIVIMLAIAIAYILTFIAQRNQIKALKETAAAHSELTQSQAVHINTYKGLFTPEELESFIKMKVELSVKELKEESALFAEYYADVVWALYSTFRNLDQIDGKNNRHEMVKMICKKSQKVTAEAFKHLDIQFEGLLPEIKSNQS